MIDRNLHKSRSNGVVFGSQWSGITSRMRKQIPSPASSVTEPGFDEFIPHKWRPLFPGPVSHGSVGWNGAAALDRPAFWCPLQLQCTALGGWCVCGRGRGQSGKSAQLARRTYGPRSLKPGLGLSFSPPIEFSDRVGPASTSSSLPLRSQGGREIDRCVGY